MHPAEDEFLEVRGSNLLMRDNMAAYLRWCGAPPAIWMSSTASRQHSARG